ncbi:MAG: hypothetical protein FWD43_04900 [Coriobacteriia bacterium]|nr:hypothetical protein [Coriobacteriia bacterium]
MNDRTIVGALQSASRFANSKFKKLILVLLAFVLIVGMFPAYALFAFAEAGDDDDTVVSKHTVVFSDADGLILKTVLVNEGETCDFWDLPSDVWPADAVDFICWTDVLPIEWADEIPEAFDFDAAITEDVTLFAYFELEDDATGDNPGAGDDDEDPIWLGPLAAPETAKDWALAMPKLVPAWSVPADAWRLEYTDVSNSKQTRLDDMYMEVSENGMYVTLYFFVSSYHKGFVSLSYRGVPGTLLAIYNNNDKNGDFKYSIWSVTLPTAGFATGTLQVNMTNGLGHGINGSITITNLSFTVQHIIFDESDNPIVYQIYTSYSGAGPAGREVRATPITISGYEYVEGYNEGDEVEKIEGIIPGQGEPALVLKLYYKKIDLFSWSITGQTRSLEYNSQEQSLSDALAAGEKLYEIDLPDGYWFEPAYPNGVALADPSGINVGFYPQDLNPGVPGRDYRIMWDNPATGEPEDATESFDRPNIGMGGLRITPKEIEITVELPGVNVEVPFTKIYGDPDPDLADVAEAIQAALLAALTAKYQDDPAVDVDAFVIEIDDSDDPLGREEGEDVGVYQYFVYVGDTSGNYDITKVIVTASLTITPAPLTVETPSASKPYDGSELTAGPAVLSGLKNDDMAEAVNTGSITYPGSVSNTYVINWGTTKASNYTIDDDLGTLTITNSAVALTIISADGAQVYNGLELTNPDFTTTMPLPDGITHVTTVVSGTQTAVGTSPNTIESYQLWNGEVDVTDFFTNVQKVSGILTVTPVTLTITANSFALTLGAPIPAYSFTATGFVNGETVADLDGSATFVCGYTPAAIAGSIWTVTVGGFASDNYIIIFQPGSVTVAAPTTPPAPTTAGYTVNHRNAATGELIATENFTGTIGATAVAVPQTIANLTYASGYAGTVLSGIIVADGSLVLTLYYTPVVTIPPDDTPTGPPPTEIPGDLTPTTNFTAWALINLILAVVGILAAVVMLIAFFSKRKQEETTHDDYEQTEQKRRKRMTWRIVNVIAGVIAVVLFFLTEDITAPMTLVDNWTIWQAVVFVAQIAFTVLALYKKKEDVQIETGTVNFVELTE